MKRLQSLDQFRGLTIVAMVLANFLAGVNLVPAWLKHAPDTGLTVIDLIAPFFIFAIGFTFRGSFQRRAGRNGLPSAYLTAARRALVLIGIGTILSAFEASLGFEHTANRWGVLEAIGVASLATLSVVRLPTGWVFATGFGLLGLYQVLLDRFWVAIVLNSSHGGLPGALGWSAMLFLAMGLADLYYHPRLPKWLFALAGLGLVGGGLLFNLLTPISKNRVSGPYVLVSLGFAVFVYCACHLSTEDLKRPQPIFELWGRNPLALYLLHMLLLGLFALPPVPAWYSQAPLWLVGLQAFALLGLMTLAAGWLERRGWILKI